MLLVLDSVQKLQCAHLVSELRDTQQIVCYPLNPIIVQAASEAETYRASANCLISFCTFRLVVFHLYLASFHFRLARFHFRYDDLFQKPRTGRIAVSPPSSGLLLS